MSEKRKLRRQSRRLALETLFYYLGREGKTPIKECFQFVLKKVQERKEDEFAWEILQTAIENMGKAKVIIRAFAPEFTFEKIAPINRALLVLGVCEMKFMETPPVVVINEYIELAKIYGEDKSASLINGVLDNYRKSLGLSREKKDS